MEHGIRQVIERAARAAEGDAGLVPDDVKVLEVALPHPLHQRYQAHRGQHRHPHGGRHGR
ncbi:MAG: hypothetical protein ACLTDR_11260 [Adlercreutzia equolifaciens]